MKSTARLALPVFALLGMMLGGYSLKSEPIAAQPADTAAPFYYVSPAGDDAFSLDRRLAKNVTVLRDLEYATYELGGERKPLLLDLYLPTGVSQPLSLIVYIHGGGWFEGSKSTCPGTTFAQTGYAMACIDYRLSSLAGGCPEELIFPAQIHDVKAAVRWLRNHASAYGLNPNRFGALGNSSGGHLAALWGVSAGVTALEGANNLGISDEVQAVADWYGPVDVTRGHIVFMDNPCKVPLSELIARYGGEETPYFYWTLAWGAFLGGSLADPAVLARAAEASPVTYVDAADPPFLVIHGENDGMVPISQSEWLVAALKRAVVDVTFVHLPGLGHSFAGPPGSGQEVHPAFLEPTLEFFDRYLAADNPTITMAEVSTSVRMGKGTN
ncbi:MAG: alpha/beta hydrolase [Acidobacteria bacterium]|nr:alpha/beta hydrolase [Acidobacteriota bacterium]